MSLGRRSEGQTPGGGQVTRDGWDKPCMKEVIQ